MSAIPPAFSPTIPRAITTTWEIPQKPTEPGPAGSGSALGLGLGLGLGSGSGSGWGWARARGLAQPLTHVAGVGWLFWRRWAPGRPGPVSRGRSGRDHDGPESAF
ncbi:hypothetical protein GCM10010435_86660 [Winogradskya consettensis]